MCNKEDKSIKLFGLSVTPNVQIVTRQFSSTIILKFSLCWVAPCKFVHPSQSHYLSIPDRYNPFKLISVLVADHAFHLRTKLNVKLRIKSSSKGGFAYFECPDAFNAVIVKLAFIRGSSPTIGASPLFFAVSESAFIPPYFCIVLVKIDYFAWW